MSVTILNETEKAEVLIAGLRKNLNEVKQLNITASGIDHLETSCKALLSKDAEVEELRRQLTKMVHENNEMLADLKTQMLTMRKAVKSRYSQPEWIRFGVQDKRQKKKRVSSEALSSLKIRTMSL